MELTNIILRALLYAGAILAMGSVALKWSLSPRQGEVFDGALLRQTWLGLLLVLAGALGLMLNFQLSIAGGDMALALSPEFLALLLQVPVGHANLVRIAGVIVLAVALSLNRRWLTLFAGGALVLSFGLEGHSLSLGPRLVTMTLVWLHVLIVFWWLAVILPLMVSPRRERDRYGESFGKQAVLAVPLLIAAGVILFGLFTGWQIDFSQDYQRRMALKLLAVAATLGLAAANKLWFTGRPGFIWALGAEAVLAVSLIGLTAYLTATGPDM